MIIINIMGGLGNQMFQYAVAKHLSIIHNTPLKIDTSNFDRCTPNRDHTLQLNSFKITAPQALRSEVADYRKTGLKHKLGIASLLNALGVPEVIVEATVDHDHLRPLPNPVRSLGDVLYIANMLSGGHFEWLMQDQASGHDTLIPLEQKYAHLLPDIEALTNEMLGSFG